MLHFLNAFFSIFASGYKIVYRNFVVLNYANSIYLIAGKTKLIHVVTFWGRNILALNKGTRVMIKFGVKMSDKITLLKGGHVFAYKNTFEIQ